MLYYPENKLSSYTTKLHTPLRLVGEWEVSLVEINYPRTWYNISGDTCKIQYRTDESGELKSISIAPGYYEDVQQILDEIKKNLSENARRSIVLYVKRQSRKMVISCQNGSGIVINGTMAQMFGFEKSGLFRKDNFGSFPVDVHRGFYTFYLYTDIVPSQYVGDAHAPLLRTIDFDHTKIGGMVSRTYNSPHYVPIKVRDIETVKIDIRLNSGDFVPFESGQVISKLHFRLKRSPYLI